LNRRVKQVLKSKKISQTMVTVHRIPKTAHSQGCYTEGHKVLRSYVLKAKQLTEVVFVWFGICQWNIISWDSPQIFGKVITWSQWKWGI